MALRVPGLERIGNKRYPVSTTCLERCPQPRITTTFAPGLGIAMHWMAVGESGPPRAGSVDEANRRSVELQPSNPAVPCVPKRLNALIITYYFPPDGAIGGVRPYQFARHFPEFGVDPWILTVEP